MLTSSISSASPVHEREATSLQRPDVSEANQTNWLGACRVENPNPANRNQNRFVYIYFASMCIACGVGTSITIGGQMSARGHTT